MAACDDVAGLVLTTTIELGHALTVRVELANTSDREQYLLDGLSVTLPVPQRAADLASFTGRWTREFHPVRTPRAQGAWTAENRRGPAALSSPATNWRTSACKRPRCTPRLRS